MPNQNGDRRKPWPAYLNVQNILTVLVLGGGLIVTGTVLKGNVEENTSEIDKIDLKHGQRIVANETKIESNREIIEEIRRDAASRKTKVEDIEKTLDKIETGVNLLIQRAIDGRQPPRLRGFDE